MEIYLQQNNKKLARRKINLLLNPNRKKTFYSVELQLGCLCRIFFKKFVVLLIFLMFMCYRSGGIRKMSKDIAALRLQYKSPNEIFTEDSIEKKEPFSLFKQWFDKACTTPEIMEPNAISLATVNKAGHPSVRFVLLKDFSERGFTFFTNYNSRKAQDIAENPNVAIAMYWLPLHRSVRIEGVATKVTKEESKTYFHSRPKASQIGALASPQSEIISSREWLDSHEKDVKEKVGDGEVPLPNWGGYLVTPHTIEFWQGQTNRLHDRIRFRKFDGDESKLDKSLTKIGENGWIYERLAP